MRGARIGDRKFFENNAPLDRFLSGCVDVLKKAGAIVVDPADLPTHGKIDAPESEAELYEFKDGLNRYLSRLSADSPARSLKELIEYNEKNRQREMPIFEQELFVQSEAKGPLSEGKYVKARADCLRLSRKEGIDAVISKHNLDAIATLTSGPAWYIDTINGHQDTGGCTTPAAVAGYPHITVPAGLFRRLPIGLSFFGTAWSEPTLIQVRLCVGAADRGKAETNVCRERNHIETRNQWMTCAGNRQPGGCCAEIAGPRSWVRMSNLATGQMVELAY